MQQVLNSLVGHVSLASVLQKILQVRFGLCKDVES